MLDVRWSRAGFPSSPTAPRLVSILDVRIGFAVSLVEPAFLRVPGTRFPTTCALARRELCFYSSDV